LRKIILKTKAPKIKMGNNETSEISDNNDISDERESQDSD